MISYFFWLRLRSRLNRAAHTDHYDRMVVKPHMSDAQISRQLKEAEPSPSKAFKPLVGMAIDLVLLGVLLTIGWRVLRYFLAF